MALFAITLVSAKAQEPTLQVDEQVDCGSSFTLTATPMDDNLYHFVMWSDNNTDNPRVFESVEEALTLTAIFAHNDLIISFTAQDGIGEVRNAEGKPITEIKIPFGEKRTVTAVPTDDCYTFEGWYKTGEEDPYSTSAILEIEGSENLSLEAHFVKIKYEVKISLAPGSEAMGTVTLSKN